MELGTRGFISSPHPRTRLPECPKVRELEMDVQGGSFPSLCYYGKMLPFIHFHPYPGFSTRDSPAGLELEVTSPRSAKTLSPTGNKINNWRYSQQLILPHTSASGACSQSPVAVGGSAMG